jgi:CHASE1-domain containing sensor protein
MSPHLTGGEAVAMALMLLLVALTLGFLVFRLDDAAHRHEQERTDAERRAESEEWHS